MSKSQNGFIIIGVMILGALVTAGFFVAQAFKKIIDKETQLSNIRHTSYIIEDSIRSSLASIAYDPSTSDPLQARNNVITQIKKSAMTLDLTHYIRMPIPNTTCGANNRPCNILVQSVKFIDDTCNLQTTSSENCSAASEATATKAILSIKSEYYKETAGVGAIELKGGGLKEISVPIPRVTEIQNYKSLAIGILKCPLSKPIFKGTEIINARSGQELRAVCESSPLKSFSTSTCTGSSDTSCTTQKIECNKSNGYWLTGVNSDLSINCDRFPAGTGVGSTVITLCPQGQVTTGFNLNNKFQASNVKCRDKGGPYDFSK